MHSYFLFLLFVINPVSHFVQIHNIQYSLIKALPSCNHFFWWHTIEKNKMFIFYNLIKTKLLLQLSSKQLGLQHFPKSKEDSLTSIEWLFQSIVTSPEKRHLLFTFSQSSDKCVTIYSFSLDFLIGQANAVWSRHTLAIVSGFSFPEGLSESKYQPELDLKKKPFEGNSAQILVVHQKFEKISKQPFEN